jgi:hypothetical protein
MIDVSIFYNFFQASAFCYHMKEWGHPVHYVVLFLKISGPQLVKIAV